PRNPLVVDPLGPVRAVVQLRGDPRRAHRGVLLVDRPDSLREPRVGLGPGCPGRRGGLPCVERRTLDIEQLAQPLHLVGVLVVGDELEAGHQFVSPAQYLAADRRMSRSTLSLACSERSTAFSASSRLIRSSGDWSIIPAPEVPGWGCGLSGLRVKLPSAAVFLPVPCRSSQCRSVPRSMPRSSAMPRTVAPGVDSYKST